MAKVTFVLGLCGSGKTHLMDEITETTGALQLCDLIGKRRLPELIAMLATGKDCLVEEIACCGNANRYLMTEHLKVTMPQVAVEWIYFANDRATADWNVTHRTNKGDPEGHRRINRDWHPLYDIPPGTVTRPIYRIPPRP